MDDDGDFHGGGRNVRVHKIQRAHATLEPIGGMNQVWMNSQRMAAMQASRPLPEFVVLAQNLPPPPAPLPILLVGLIVNA